MHKNPQSTNEYCKRIDIIDFINIINHMKFSFQNNHIIYLRNLKLH